MLLTYKGVSSVKKYLLLGIILFLFGCQPDEQKVESEEIDTQSTRIESAEIEVLSDAYLAEDISDDLTGDGVEEQIILYISPPPIFNEQGEAAWDDSHVWQLIVKDQEKLYPLHNESVQFGILDFWIVEKEGKKELLLFTEGNGLKLDKFTFDKDAFVKEEILYEGMVSKRSISEW